MKKVLLLLVMLLSIGVYSQEYNCSERRAYLERENIAVNNLNDDVNVARREATRTYDIATSISDRIYSWYTPGTYSYNKMVGEYNIAARKNKKATEYSNSLLDIYKNRYSTLLDDIKEFNSKCASNN